MPGTPLCPCVYDMLRGVLTCLAKSVNMYPILVNPLLWGAGGGRWEVQHLIGLVWLEEMEDDLVIW